MSLSRVLIQFTFNVITWVWIYHLLFAFYLFHPAFFLCSFFPPFSFTFGVIGLVILFPLFINSLVIYFLINLLVMTLVAFLTWISLRIKPYRKRFEWLFSQFFGGWYKASTILDVRREVNSLGLNSQVEKGY